MSDVSTKMKLGLINLTRIFDMQVSVKSKKIVHFLDLFKKTEGKHNLSN